MPPADRPARLARAQDAASPLGGPLWQIKKEDRLSEIEFLYPEIDGPAADRFITGYMDFLFRKDGRYYLLDWKTNLLPAYSAEQIERSMADSDYHRQYELYLRAIERWLTRVHGPGFDFLQRFGGVFYLYLCGLNGRDDTSGVFFHRPTRVSGCSGKSPRGDYICRQRLMNHRAPHASEEVMPIRGFVASFIGLLLAFPIGAGEKPLKIAVFEADVTPPLGTPLCDALVMPAKEIVDPLSARGIILFTSEKPIVLCAVDWVGVGNSGHTAFRNALAKAAGTSRERVCVHCLHQHDAPGCDFEADELLAKHGLGGKLFDPAFARKAIERVARAVEKATKNPRTVTHLGVGKAKVVDVASSRRVMGPDGKVKFVRYSSTKDAKIRAEPEGLIDPFVQALVFFNGDTPISILTYYATHPQSYYGKGGVSCDFPGLARNRCEREAGWPMQIHFNARGAMSPPASTTTAPPKTA